MIPSQIGTLVVFGQVPVGQEVEHEPAYKKFPEMHVVQALDAMDVHAEQVE